MSLFNIVWYNIKGVCVISRGNVSSCRGVGKTEVNPSKV